jgi:hypothetical protein
MDEVLEEYQPPPANPTPELGNNNIGGMGDMSGMMGGEMGGGPNGAIGGAEAGIPSIPGAGMGV